MEPMTPQQLAYMRMKKSGGAPNSSMDASEVRDLDALMAASSSEAVGTTFRHQGRQPVMYKPDCISFAALYMETIDTTKRAGDAAPAATAGTGAAATSSAGGDKKQIFSILRTLLPLNLQTLALETPTRVATGPGQTRPLYECTSVDEEALGFTTKVVRGEKVGKTYARHHIPLTTSEDELAAQLANRNLLSVKEPAQGKQDLKPFSFVTVRNLCFCEYYNGNKGRNEYEFKVDLLDGGPWEALNALTLPERLAIAFPAHVDTMPSISDWMVLKPYLNNALVPGAGIVTSTDDINMARKKRNGFLRQLCGGLSPVGHWRSNRTHEMGKINALGSASMPVLPGIEDLYPDPVEAAKRPMNKHKGLLAFKETVHHTKVDEKTGAVSHSILGSADFVSGLPTYTNDATNGQLSLGLEGGQLYQNCTLFASHFAASMPIYYPRWIQRAMALHPIPLDVLLGVDIYPTVIEPANNGAAEADGTALPPYEQGHLTGNVLASYWHMPRYLQRAAIPTTRSLFVHRYKKELVRFVPCDFDRESQLQAFKGDIGADNTPTIQMMERDGCIACDTSSYHELPDEGDPRAAYYVLPLIPLEPEKLPMENRADPFNSLAADDVRMPQAVALTPEQGDALVKSEIARLAAVNASAAAPAAVAPVAPTPTQPRGRGPVAAPPPPPAVDPWVQKGDKVDGMPVFLFFVVWVEAPEVIRERRKAAAEQMAALYPIVDRSLPKKTLQLNQYLKRAGTVAGLRRQCFEAVAGVQPTTTTTTTPEIIAVTTVPPTVTMTDAPAETKKTKREDDELSGPAAKRPRLDTVHSPQPPSTEEMPKSEPEKSATAAAADSMDVDDAEEEEQEEHDDVDDDPDFTA